MIISTARSRKTKIWSRLEITWDDFVKSLKTPRRTSEKQQDYFNLPKEEQDEIKDVGGFVGGELKDGLRRSGTVINRCLITLDADYDNGTIVKWLRDNANYTYCIYSTHRHTKDNPRYRLIIPLSRPCTSEEYEAVARKVASDIDIELFDDTTYQAHRLMYYPSVSKDGDYVYKASDIALLDVDSVLKSYDNWRDPTQWPVSNRDKTRVRKQKNRQQDPRDKGGLIGAFCQMYTIQEAIEHHLKDVYTHYQDNRYTYVRGSTVGGC